jgi:hypothetical protein
MGHGDLFLGPHGEGGTEQRDIWIIATIGIGPPLPLWSPCKWASRPKRSRLGQPPNSAQSTLRHRQVHRRQAPCIVQPEEGGHSDRRTASTPAMAAAAAKNIAKRSASYAHANPRLKKETNAIMVSSRTLASNPSPPICCCRAPANARSGWHPWPELDCIPKMASILLDAVCGVNRENTS